MNRLIMHVKMGKFQIGVLLDKFFEYKNSNSNSNNNSANWIINGYKKNKYSKKKILFLSNSLLIF